MDEPDPRVDFEPVVVEVTESDVIDMMDVMGDVNPVHFDHELVAELGLRGLVNQGPCNLAYALSPLLAWAGDPATVRHIDVRFDAVTCPGDRLVASGGVAATRAAEAGDVAVCEFRLDRELGDGTTEQILTGTAEVLLAERR